MNKLLIRATLVSLATAACGLAGAMTVDAPAVAAQAAAFSCAEPAIPAYSVSNEGARRVQKQLVQWQQCASGYLSQSDNAEAHAVVAVAAQDVAQRYNSWLVGTARYNNGQADGRFVQTRVERDWAAAIARPAVRHASTRYVAPRPDNAVRIQVGEAE